MDFLPEHVTITKATPEDSQDFLFLRTQLEQETNFMVFTKGERTLSVEKIENQIREISQYDNQVLFIARYNGKPAGFLMVYHVVAKKLTYTGELAIGIIAEHEGKGIGSALMYALDEWNTPTKLHRIELDVDENNVQAIRLYEKFGFEVEGIRRDAIFLDGKFLNKIQMARLYPIIL